MRATRVGVHTLEAGRVNGARRIACERCSITRVAPDGRKMPPLCPDCRTADPLWGKVPFDQFPTSDSNVCAFDEPFDPPRNRRRRAARARKNREETP
jgi:hypothetical protein